MLQRDPATRARSIARLLDTAVRVPGTSIRFGLDAVLGLVPGIGDFAGAALSGYVILTAARAGAPNTLLARMLANVGLDTLVGAVPLLGDLFDVAFRANVRNAALLDDWLVRSGQGEPGTVTPVRLQPSRRGAIVLVLGGVLLIAVVGGALAWLLLREINLRLST